MVIYILKNVQLFKGNLFVECKTTMWQLYKICMYLLFSSDNWWNTLGRHVKFGMEIDHKHTYKFYVKYLGQMGIKNTGSVLCWCHMCTDTTLWKIPEASGWLRRKVTHYSVCMWETCISNKGGWIKNIHHMFLLSDCT